MAKDSQTTVLRETLLSARQAGHAGPPGRKASEVLSKCILVDMLARSLQDMAPVEAVKWTAVELRKIDGA